MDSEAIAHMCAQQKHHRYMLFGKKQRYIEVFQCSGDDMNMVLHGAQFQPPTSNISKPPLLSPGMLQQPQSTPQAALSLPVSPTAVPPLTLSIPQMPTVSQQSPSAALIAQQQAQAQFIAQQNLLARQQAVAVAQAQQQAQAQQNEHLLLQQLGYYTTPPPSNGPPSNALSPSQAQQLNSLQLASQFGPQMVYMSRGMMPSGLHHMGQMGYMSGLGGIPGLTAFQGYGPVVTGLPPTPAMSPNSPYYSTAYTSPLIMSPSSQSMVTASASGGANTSRKRGYDSAFQGDPSNVSNTAKRQYTAPPPTPSQAQMQAQAAAATAAYYSQFYPPPM